MFEHILTFMEQTKCTIEVPKMKNYLSNSHNTEHITNIAQILVKTYETALENNDFMPLNLN